MSAIPQEEHHALAPSAPPPSHGATVKNEPDPPHEVQPLPSGQQLPEYVQYPAQQQVPYMVPAPVFQQQPAFIKPDYPGPHDFLILSIIVMTVCLILNLTSLALGIPALVFAILSNVANSNYNYEKASKYARTAIALNVTNIVYTLVLSLVIIGPVVWSACTQFYGSGFC